MKLISFARFLVTGAVALFSYGAFAQSSLVGVWSISAQWGRCTGPFGRPSLVQLFSDGTWDSIPSDTNIYKDFRWTASADGKSFALSEPGVWAHYFTLTGEGIATGRSGDKKGCFRARYLHP